MAEIEVIPASGEDWHAFIARAGQPDGATERVVLEVHQRLLAVESGVGGVAGNPGYAFAATAPATADGLSPVEPAPQAPQGVTVDELVDCLPNPFRGDLESFAQLLLDHPRIGPLLRGEGAFAPKLVALPEEPPDKDPPVWMTHREAYAWNCGRSSAWAGLVIEMVRQQGGQADG